MLKIYPLIFMAFLISACSDGSSDSQLGSIPKTQVNLSWLSPTEDEDGTGLLEGEITGFNIYYGTEIGHYTSSVYVEKSELNSFVLSSLPEGKYYFAMKSILDTGEESGFSDEYYINTEI